MFVFDLSGQAGDKSSIKDQLLIRKSLRERFPKRPWIDVLSKSDLERDDVLRIGESAKDLVAMIPTDAISVSVNTGANLQLLKETVIAKLIELSLKK